MADKKMHQVTFLPEGKTIAVEDRKSIFETILLHNPHNIELKFACGAEGICQKCKIRAFQKMGPVTPTERGCLSDDELGRGVRLACQARVIQDTTVEIIYKRPFSIELTGEDLVGDITLAPRVRKLFYADTSQLDFDTPVKVGEKAVPNENNAGRTAVFSEKELLCIETGDTRNRCYGAAVDLGTNTLVVSLIDFLSGKKIASVVDTNPQLEIGADLKSRIGLVGEDDMNLDILNEEILLRLDILITELCRACAVDPLHVYEVTIAGSTGMLHLMVSGIANIMAENRDAPSFFTAEQLEIRSASHARVYLLPSVSSAVGADMVSDILATRIHESDQTVLLLDIGSAIKAILCYRKRILAAAVYDTGIFECIGVMFGMRPETGAIDRVNRDEDPPFAVIGESLPRGICGSGLIELAAFLKKEGIIDDCGKFCCTGGNPELRRNVFDIGQTKAFLLYRDTGEFDTDIYVTQSDFQALFEGASRIAERIKALELRAGIGINDIPEIIVCGAFGHNVDTRTFKEIGLLPAAFSGRIIFAGNSSNKGAQLALVNKTVLRQAETLVKTIELVSA